jgi:hypothetical protein
MNLNAGNFDHEESEGYEGFLKSLRVLRDFVVFSELSASCLDFYRKASRQNKVANFFFAPEQWCNSNRRGNPLERDLPRRVLHR